jgi:hypothetical protein
VVEVLIHLTVEVVLVVEVMVLYLMELNLNKVALT